ncbi:MAG TPA: hypothetical protein VOA87_09170 [Thermoanaerobaculia bacterium]|nr:hypothetical protein [Thermoanaerobaculia bacterium]
MRSKAVSAFLAALVLGLPGSGLKSQAEAKPAAAPAAAAGSFAASAEGLWQGLLMYKPAELEVDVIVELAKDAKGAWVGTLDLPNQNLKFHPLENIRIDGSAVYFEFNRFAQKAQVMVETPFTGTLSADGKTISGDFFEGKKNHLALTLKKVGEAGTERTEAPRAPVTNLSDDYHELKARFNADAGKVRLILLLSPT